MVPQGKDGAEMDAEMDADDARGVDQNERTETAAPPSPSPVPGPGPNPGPGPGPGDVDAVRLPPVDPARYHVVREFARGGLGRILEVRDLRIGRTVALKEILRERGAAGAPS